MTDADALEGMTPMPPLGPEDGLIDEPILDEPVEFPDTPDDEEDEPDEEGEE